jgi:phosphate transport system ATP-binding protein
MTASFRIASTSLGAPTKCQPEPTYEKISVRKLTFYWQDGTRVLKNISVPIYAKKVTSLIGPTRCGKTTLLRVLNRLYDLVSGQYAEGEVLLDGANILRRGQDVTLLRSRIGMVLSEPAPFPMSIYKNVAFGIRLNRRLPRGELDAEVEWALRRVALWDEVKDKLSRYGTVLLAGQQQRLCIARSIATRPEVLLFDEPCAWVDAASAAKIEQTISELKEDHTVVVATHNLHQAARVSDFVGVMFEGELVEFDTAQRILTAPHDLRTERFVTGRLG